MDFLQLKRQDLSKAEAALSLGSGAALQGCERLLECKTIQLSIVFLKGILSEHVGKTCRFLKHTGAHLLPSTRMSVCNVKCAGKKQTNVRLMHKQNPNN